MRRKAFAVSLGLATPGRGRMSREALDAIDAAIKEGKVFDDMPGAPRERVERTVTHKPATERVSAAGGSVSASGDTRIRYSTDTVFVGEDSKGKTQKVNARAICRRTGYSITGCYCTGPGHEALVASTMEVITVHEK